MLTYIHKDRHTNLPTQMRQVICPPSSLNVKAGRSVYNRENRRSRLRTEGAAKCTVKSVVVCIKLIAVVNKILAHR